MVVVKPLTRCKYLTLHANSIQHDEFNQQLFVNTIVKKCLKILTKDIVQITNYSYRNFDSFSNARCNSSPRQYFSGSLNSAHCRTVTFQARPAFFKSYHAKVCASVGTVRGVDSMDRCGLTGGGWRSHAGR